MIEHLDLTGVTLIGFSMGGGEVARYVGRENAPHGLNVTHAHTFNAEVLTFLRG